jgi:serine/threonine-protein kinase
VSQSDDATLDSGTVIGGRYRLRRPVGGGGMGVVYEAESIDLGRRCAVKLVRARGSLDAAARLKREAHAVAKLTHPNVVHVFDFVDDEKLGPALVMELLTGEPLSGRLSRKGALSVAEARAIFGQVLDGLGAAHDAGMIHRDIKPSNLFLVALAGGQVVAKVLDFGIVRWVAPRDELSLTGSADWLGTPQYMAPEVLLHRPSDERADLYAVGCCLYQALTGTPPFEAENAIAIAHDVVNGPGLPLERLPASVPDSVRELIRVATHKDPHERFGTAAEMRAALLATEDASVVSAADPMEPRTPPSAGPATTTRVGRSDRSWLPLVAIALFAALALGAMVSRGGEPPGTTPPRIAIEARETAVERPSDSEAVRGAGATASAPSVVPSAPATTVPQTGTEELATTAAPPRPSAPAEPRTSVEVRRRRASSPDTESASPSGTSMEPPQPATSATSAPAPRLGEDIVDPYAAP